MSELHSNLVAFNLERTEKRTRVLDLLIVSIRQRPQRKTMSDIRFVPRMNIVRVADIDDDRHSRLRFTQSHRLRFAKFGPFTFTGIGFHWLKVCQLDEVEREVAFIPGAAPVANHQRKKCAVLIGPTCVALALIPDCTPNRNWKNRSATAVV